MIDLIELRKKLKKPTTSIPNSPEENPPNTVESITMDLVTTAAASGLVRGATATATKMAMAKIKSKIFKKKSKEDPKKEETLVEFKPLEDDPKKKKVDPKKKTPVKTDKDKGNDDPDKVKNKEIPDKEDDPENLDKDNKFPTKSDIGKVAQPPSKVQQKPLPPSDQDQDKPDDPEDVVKLGTKTPVIINPTADETANKTDGDAVNLSKEGQQDQKKKVAEEAIKKHFGKKVNSPRLRKSLDKLETVRSKKLKKLDEMVTPFLHGVLSKHKFTLTNQKVRTGTVKDIYHSPKHPSKINDLHDHLVHHGFRLTTPNNNEGYRTYSKGNADELVHFYPHNGGSKLEHVRHPPVSEETITELSKRVLKKYVQHASLDLKSAAYMAGNRDQQGNKDRAQKFWKVAEKRNKGIWGATNRLAAEEALHEVSKDTLKSYAEKALGDVLKGKKVEKREAGYSKAVQKYAAKEETESLDEGDPVGRIVGILGQHLTRYAYHKIVGKPQKPVKAPKAEKEHDKAFSQMSAKDFRKKRAKSDDNTVGRAPVDIDDKEKLKDMIKKGQINIKANNGRMESLTLSRLRQLLEATHNSGGGSKGQGSKGQDTSGDNHPINVAKKAVKLGKATLKHENGETTDLSAEKAHHILNHYDSVDHNEKRDMIGSLLHSKKHMHQYLNGVRKENLSDKPKISLGGSKNIGGIGRSLSFGATGGGPG